MTAGSCYRPVARGAKAAAPDGRALDAHRAVRYDGLLQLIGEVQRRRSIEDVARVVAARWKIGGYIAKNVARNALGASIALHTAPGRHHRDAASSQTRKPRP